MSAALPPQLIHVHTLGDSTLDNWWWTKKATTSVEGQLKQQLGVNYGVESHAYDGFTTKSILLGDYVGRVLGITPHAYPGLQTIYLENRGINPQSDSYFVNPFDQLRASVAKNPDDHHYVILSVGETISEKNLAIL